MNIHELPMIVFTVLSQMSVGAFVALGIVQLHGASRYDRQVLDRLANPALLAIGPTLVAGLIASMFHMNDVTNTINVLRHWDSSWLSREIIFGAGFAGLGFFYFVAQWRGWFSSVARQLLAGLTALVGLSLVWSQAMIYYSLVTVPGWNHWVTPVRFYATTIMLGALAVGVAMAASLSQHRPRTAASVDGRLVPADTGGDYQAVGGGRLGSTLAVMTRQTTLTDTQTVQADKLVREALRIVALVTAITAVALLIAIPLYAADLHANPTEAAADSAAVYTGAFFITRLVLLAIGAIGLALVSYRATAIPEIKPAALTAIVAAALVVTFISEIMGRSLFYDTIARVGM